MARIFWITCPKCEKKFYAATHEFRHTNRPLWCPYCGNRFTVDEAKEVID